MTENGSDDAQMGCTLTLTALVRLDTNGKRTNGKRTNGKCIWQAYLTSANGKRTKARRTNMH